MIISCYSSYYFRLINTCNSQYRINKIIWLNLSLWVGFCYMTLMSVEFISLRLFWRLSSFMPMIISQLLEALNCWFELYSFNLCAQNIRSPFHLCPSPIYMVFIGVKWSNHVTIYCQSLAILEAVDYEIPLPWSEWQRLFVIDSRG